MSCFPDLGHDTPVASGEHVRAVGWLQPDHPHTEGAVPVEFFNRLKEFIALSGHGADALYFGAYAGYHRCESCDRSHGVSNFGVLGVDELFVAPEMVAHYIQDHSYRPPQSSSPPCSGRRSPTRRSSNCSRNLTGICTKRLSSVSLLMHNVAPWQTRPAASAALISI